MTCGGRTDSRRTGQIAELCPQARGVNVVLSDVQAWRQQHLRRAAPVYDQIHYLLTILSSIVLLWIAWRAFAFVMKEEWGSAITMLIGGAAVSAFVYAPEQVTNWLRAAVDATADAGTAQPAQNTPPPAPRLEAGDGLDVPWEQVVTAVLIAAAVIGLTAGGRYLHRRRTTLRKRRSDLEQRHDIVLDSYADFATDILAVLDRPSLADVTVPETERFIHALDAARDARAYADADYRAAVGELEIAWKAADRRARKQGTTLLPVLEQRAVQQARLLLATALDENGNSHERQLAYRRAMQLIEGIIDVPREAAAELDCITRLSLPPHESPQTVTLTKTKDRT
ncbi:TcpD family membrane protein [Streptomyces sp. NPDC059835]|uniref:TcpD family membrane protein n=1 Tax=Streptomyces sp. NPDC059835 TaxID=3346967 RepID=UPI00365FC00B